MERAVVQRRAEVGQRVPRDDALGGLARTFARMADEVRAREARLEAEVTELRAALDKLRLQ